MINFKKFLIENVDVNSRIWYHGLTGHQDELIKSSHRGHIFLTSSKEVAILFAKSSEYSIIIDKTNIIPADEGLVRGIVSNIEPYEDLEWGLDWNIVEVFDDLDDSNIEDIYSLLNITQADTIFIHKKGAVVYEMKTSLKNVKVIDYEGKLWGNIGANLDYDAKQAFAKNYDALLGKNIQEGGNSSEIDFPIADTLVVKDQNSLKIIKKQIMES